jgi:hypothetical protein
MVLMKRKSERRDKQAVSLETNFGIAILINLISFLKNFPLTCPLI